MNWHNLGISRISKHVLNACTWIAIAWTCLESGTAPFNQSIVQRFALFKMPFTLTQAQNALIGSICVPSLCSSLCVDLFCLLRLDQKKVEQPFPIDLWGPTKSPSMNLQQHYLSSALNFVFYFRSFVRFFFVCYGQARNCFSLFYCSLDLSLSGRYCCYCFSCLSTGYILRRGFGFFSFIFAQHLSTCSFVLENLQFFQDNILRMHLPHRMHHRDRLQFIIANVCVYVCWVFYSNHSVWVFLCCENGYFSKVRPMRKSNQNRQQWMDPSQVLRKHARLTKKRFSGSTYAWREADLICFLLHL